MSKVYHITQITEIINGNGQGLTHNVDITTDDLKTIRSEYLQLYRSDANGYEIDDVYLTYKQKKGK